MKHYSFVILIFSACVWGSLYSTLSAATVKPVATPKPVAAKPITPVSVEGVYEGTVTVKTPPGAPKIQMPIVFSLEFTDDDVLTNPDEPYLVKKRIAGSFMLDGEAGPFPLNLADFEVNRGHFNLQYNRLTSAGTPSSTASLRFECDRQASGSCSGDVTSANNGKFATFTMHKSGKNAVALSPKPKYIGTWKGSIKIPNGLRDKNPSLDACAFGTICDQSSVLQHINYTLKELGLPEMQQNTDLLFSIAESDAQDQINPPTYELGTTPARTGGAYINNSGYLQFTFTEVFFDYFHRRVTLTSVNALGKTSLSGTIDKDGNFTNGIYNTPSYGLTGSFTAEKIQ